MLILLIWGVLRWSLGSVVIGAPPMLLLRREGLRVVVEEVKEVSTVNQQGNNNRAGVVSNQDEEPAPMVLAFKVPMSQLSPAVCFWMKMHQSYVVQATVPPEHREKADLKDLGYALNILQLLDSHGARHHKFTVVVNR
jgi:hypothetical protein